MRAKEGDGHERDTTGCESRCHGGGTSRRDFLTRASGMVVGGLMATGMGWREANALPIGWLEAQEAQGTERTYPVPAEDGASIDKENQVIVVRKENRLYAFALACPHENTALRWRARDQRFQCRLHDSRYEADGTFIDGRATRHMDRYAVRLQDDKLVVDLEKVYHSDEQAEEWNAAVVIL